MMLFNAAIGGGLVILFVGSSFGVWSAAGKTEGSAVVPGDAQQVSQNAWLGQPPPTNYVWKFSQIP
jgi:hypothetical protein